jgi:hypothetical protein
MADDAAAASGAPPPAIHYGSDGFPSCPTAAWSAHLSREIFDRLQPLQTRLTHTLGHCLTPTTIAAADAECYPAFAPLFDPMIAALHGVEALPTSSPAIAAAAPLLPPELSAPLASLVEAYTVIISRNLAVGWVARRVTKTT